MKFLRNTGPATLHIDGEPFGTVGDVVFETAEQPLPLNIPTTLEASFQCAPISREAIEALYGQPKPAPLEMTFTHKLQPWTPLSRRARRQKRMPFAKRRAWRREKRRHVAHNVRRALQRRSLRPAPMAFNLKVRLHHVGMEQVTGDQWSVSMDLRAVSDG